MRVDKFIKVDHPHKMILYQQDIYYLAFTMGCASDHAHGTVLAPLEDVDVQGAVSSLKDWTLLCDEM